MSHNIVHFDYDLNVNKSKVQADLDNYVRHETWQEGGHGIDPIRWNDVICEDYEAAKDWIESHDKGWYDCLAVKYKDPVLSKQKSEKEKELLHKAQEAVKLYNERNNSLYAKTRTSEYISCGNCGSKLATKYVSSNFCPLCRNDLRSDTILKSIAAAKNKMEKAIRAEREYIEKHTKKEIRWLVKIEYHT